MGTHGWYIKMIKTLLDYSADVSSRLARQHAA
jgi:hypothetical protein